MSIKPRKDTRPSASARGYGTDWRKLRDTKPKGPCVRCRAPWSNGFHLDHIKPRMQGGSDALDNLQWLCWRCHSIKTASEDGGFNNAKGSRFAKTGCTSEGLPLGKNHHWNK